MNAIIIGNKTVQQYDINWSKRILGKEALAHINTNIIIQDFRPNIKLEIKPSKKTLKKFISVSAERKLNKSMKKRLKIKNRFTNISSEKNFK